MNQLSQFQYNFLLLLLFLFQIIYGFTYLVSFQKDKCYTKELNLTLARQLQLTLNISKSQNQDNYRFLQDNNNLSSQFKLIESNIKLTTFPLIIAIFYLIIICLHIIFMIGVFCFSDYDKSRFSQLGLIRGFVGIFIKNNQILIKCLHMLILVFIIIQYILLYLTKICDDAKHINNQGETQIRQIEIEGKVVNHIMIIVWGVLHLLMPILRSIVKKEPYMYEPINYERTLLFRYMFTILGPL